MKNHKIHAFATALLFVSIQAYAQAPVGTPTPVPYTYDQLKENLTRYIQEQMGKENVKGLSIALVDGPNVVWVKGFGYADQQKKILATENTRYALGGVSRVFTAAEVVHLSEQGKILLDQPIQSYVPGFSIQSRFPKTKPITPRALLAGHSGLPGFFLKGIWVDQPETLPEFLKDLKSDYLYDPPQTHYRYSYTDYDLLGRLVELNRKKPFAIAMKVDFFDHLGMDSSAFETPLPDASTAKGYFEGNPIAQAHLRDVPAGGMVSSANDLAKFLSFLFGAEAPEEAPLSENSIEGLFTPQFPKLSLDFGHDVGMGWNLSGFNFDGLQDLAWIDGTYPGYFAAMMVSREEGLGVAILSNSSEAGKIADDLAARTLKLALQVKKGIQANLEKKKIKMPPLVVVPRETLAKYTGTYSALAQLAGISLGEKNLRLDFDGHQLDLLSVSQVTFIPRFVFILFPIDLPQYPLTFSNGGGKDVILLGGLHFPIPFVRIAPVVIPEAWKKRQGEYVLENSDGQMEFSRITLAQKGDYLTVVLKVSLKALHIKDKEFKIALLPISDEDVVVPGLFYGDGGTLHGVEDEEGNPRIFYSGYWFSKVKPPSPTPALTPVATPLKPAPRPTI